MELEDICIPVHLWHGAAVDQVPASMARHIAGKIPGGKFTICESEAPLDMFPHSEEILTQFITE
jgi:hypothetical protein